MRSLLSILLLFTVDSAVLAETIKVNRPDGSQITAYLSVPDSSMPFPAILVLQGSSCKSVQSSNRYFPQFQELNLARLDIEKYGIDENFNPDEGCPVDYLKSNTIFQRARDAVQVFQYLKENTNWSGESYLAGGSEGSVVAPIIAHKENHVRGVALLAGAGGFTMVDELKILVKKGIRICNSSNANELDTGIQSIFNNPDSINTWCGRTNSFHWWSKILLFKPVDLLVKLEVPIYVAHGSEDIASPVESSDKSYEIFQNLGKTNITYNRYDGLDHHWNDREGNNHAQQIYEDLFDWFGSIFSNSGSSR